MAKRTACLACLKTLCTHRRSELASAKKPGLVGLIRDPDRFGQGGEIDQSMRLELKQQTLDGDDYDLGAA